MESITEEEAPLKVHPTPRDAFAHLVRELEASGYDYAVLGALARSAWARERRTTDIDFTMRIPPDLFSSIVDLFARLGFDRYFGPRMPPEGGAEVPDLVSFMGRTSDPADSLRVDILVSKVKYQDLTLRRKRRARSQDVPCWVITPEDLIVHKLISHRIKDMDDIQEVLAAQDKRGKGIDWPYIKKWAKAWGVEKYLKPFLPTPRRNKSLSQNVSRTPKGPLRREEIFPVAETSGSAEPIEHGSGFGIGSKPTRRLRRRRSRATSHVSHPGRGGRGM